MARDSFDDIERRVASDRAELASSLESLSETLSPERLKQQATHTAETYGSQLSRQLWDATRENPAGFALVGAGLALLLSNAGRRGERAAQAPQPDPVATAAPTAVPPEEAMAGFDTRVAQAEAELKERSATRPTAARMRAALNRGLDKLPPKARVRVRDARLSAIRAQEKVEARASKLSRKANDMVEDQPIVASALCFGLGALMAAALPATRREDEMLGARRDALMDSAQAALAEEMDKLQAEYGQAADTQGNGPAAEGRATAGVQVPS